MTVSELKELIELKEKEYREAMKMGKLFWEVKIMYDEKKALERQLEKITIKQLS